MRRISFVGVIVGGISDIVLTGILSMPVFVYALVSSGLVAVPRAQQDSALLALVQSNGVLHATLLALGALASLLAGYIAAWIAKREEVLNGALSSFLCVASELYAFSKGQFGGPIWLAVALLPVSPALGAAGGYLRLLHRRRPRAALTPRH